MNAMAAGQAGSERFIALEGLRGLAAVGVLLSHALFAVEPGIFKTMYPLAQAAWPEIGWPAQLLTLPPLSMLINGSFAVCVFFVLSGFVLTKSFADTGNASVLCIQSNPTDTPPRHSNRGFNRFCRCHFCHGADEKS